MIHSTRIDVRDLALVLGPGVHDLSNMNLVVRDGEGRELTIKLAEATLEVRETTDAERD